MHQGARVRGSANGKISCRWQNCVHWYANARSHSFFYTIYFVIVTKNANQLSCRLPKYPVVRNAIENGTGHGFHLSELKNSAMLIFISTILGLLSAKRRGNRLINLCLAKSASEWTNWEENVWTCRTIIVSRNEFASVLPIIGTHNWSGNENEKWKKKKMSNYTSPNIGEAFQICKSLRNWIRRNFTEKSLFSLN